MRDCKVDQPTADVVMIVTVWAHQTKISFVEGPRDPPRCPASGRHPSRPSLVECTVVVADKLPTVGIPAVNIVEPTVGRLLRVTQHQNGTDGQDAICDVSVAPLKPPGTPTTLSIFKKARHRLRNNASEQETLVSYLARPSGRPCHPTHRPCYPRRVIPGPNRRDQA